MSSDAIAKLPSPIKDLVAASVADSSVSSEAKPEVDEWIGKVASGQVGKTESLKELDAQLTPRTYIVDNVLTLADVAVYGALHPTISRWQPAQYYSHPALTRYFDHIQNRSAVRTSAEKLSPAFSLVSFDLDNAPAQQRSAEPPKKKEKKPVAEAVKEKVSKVKEKVVAVSEKAAEKKREKADKKPVATANEEGSKKGGPSQKQAEDVGEPQPSMIDLRIGKIVEISKHPDADSLYVEKIDFGEETGPRTVVSGLVNYIPIEEMRDRYLVGVCNLKPASMRGVKSFAMVLCATSKDGKDGGIELVKPPENSKIGDKVYFEGADYESEKAFGSVVSTQSKENSIQRKKIFESVQPGFTTLDTHEAAWVNPVTKSVHRIRTKEGVCIAPTFVGASLS